MAGVVLAGAVIQACEPELSIFFIRLNGNRTRIAINVSQCLNRGTLSTAFGSPPCVYDVEDAGCTLRSVMICDPATAQWQRAAGPSVDFVDRSPILTLPFGSAVFAAPTQANMSDVVWYTTTQKNGYVAWPGAVQRATLDGIRLASIQSELHNIAADVLLTQFGTVPYGVREVFFDTTNELVMTASATMSKYLWLGGRAIAGTILWYGHSQFEIDGVYRPASFTLDFALRSACLAVSKNNPSEWKDLPCTTPLMYLTEVSFTNPLNGTPPGLCALVQCFAETLAGGTKEILVPAGDFLSLPPLPSSLEIL